MYSPFCNNIISAANISIPKAFQARKKFSSCSWWNADCASKVKERKLLFIKYRQNQSIGNFLAYKKVSADTKRFLRFTKKQFRTNYCETLNRTTPLTEVWSTELKKMKNRFLYKPLSKNVCYFNDCVDDFAQKVAPQYVQHQIVLRREDVHSKHYQLGIFF